MNVLITGASGMVGKGVLLECIDHPKVKKVISIGRSEIKLEHPKLKQIVHKDFLDYSPVAEQLKDLDACYLCMGISAVGLSEQEYANITYNYTLALAKTLLDKNSGMTCTYVSGQGTDSSEKGKTMWARVKGKTENDLLNLGFKKAFMYRPGMIIPLRGIKSKTKLYQFMYDYFMWMVKLVKWLSPNSVVNTTQLGKSMISVTLHGYSKKILDPKDIIASSELV